MIAGPGAPGAVTGFSLRDHAPTGGDCCGTPEAHNGREMPIQLTIDRAIEDRNVLRFHVDYYRPDGTNLPKPGDTISKRAVVETILAKHDIATSGRTFNALFATASIDDAIEYYEHFNEAQTDWRRIERGFVPLTVSVVFSPPADVCPDVKQILEDLPQEQQDNRHDPDAKKHALAGIISDYNECFGTGHRIEAFDLYYRDVQQRIKDQQWPEADLRKANPGAAQHKIDITIVVDMLLAGFDSPYLNTLYVDKDLKHHGLIQAFSRTTLVLNDTKPCGHILDFRGQQDAVDAAIALFAGARTGEGREIWLVDTAPVVIDRLREARRALQNVMQSQGLSGRPEDVANLEGDEARVAFMEAFKKVQTLQTQLDQYTDLTIEQAAAIRSILPKDELNAFRSQYLETAQRLAASAGS